MKITLFDWTAGGHHPVYLRRFAEALLPRADVVLAVPDEVAEQFSDLPSAPLGPPRPDPEPTSWTGVVRRKLGPLAPSFRRMARQEVELMRRVSGDSDHIVNLYADPALGALSRAEALPARTSALLFFPSAHYPAAYATPLTPRERAGAAVVERSVRRWLARPDAHALLTLDETAAQRWAGGARWIPEPPVPALVTPPPPAQRSGCVVFGALAPRKGIGRLAGAVAPGMRVVLAGAVEPTYAATLDEEIDRMRSLGAEVDARLERQSDRASLEALAAARCAVLPYPRHVGMSRVLVEAASVGTPVVAHERGLLGHEVRTHGLGLAVDCGDARVLREALLTFTEDAAAVEARQPALAEYAARSAPEAFRAALDGVFATPEPALQ